MNKPTLGTGVAAGAGTTLTFDHGTDTIHYLFEVLGWPVCPDGTALIIAVILFGLIFAVYGIIIARLAARKAYIERKTEVKEQPSP